MRRLTSPIAFCVAVLLLAAPAAFACGELGGFESHCPMMEMPGEMSGEMPGSMGTMSCHDREPTSMDCCEVAPAPEPMPALSFKSVQLVESLEVVNSLVAAPLVPTARPAHSPLADAFRLNGLGRYALFSSLLL